jgi:large subunit ribosomal protein L31
MRKNLHPDYHEITVVMTNGTEYVTRSTYGKPGDRLSLDIDPNSHPAWTGNYRALDRGGQLAKFNKRFSGLGAGKEAAATNAPAANAEAPAEESKIKITTGKKK